MFNCVLVDSFDAANYDGSVNADRVQSTWKSGRCLDVVRETERPLARHRGSHFSDYSGPAADSDVPAAVAVGLGRSFCGGRATTLTDRRTGLGALI